MVKTYTMNRKNMSLQPYPPLRLRPYWGLYKKSILKKRTLIRKGITVLSDLYKSNQKFKVETIDFIRDKTELGVD